MITETDLDLSKTDLNNSTNDLENITAYDLENITAHDLDDNTIGLYSAADSLLEKTPMCKYQGGYILY